MTPLIVPEDLKLALNAILARRAASEKALALIIQAAMQTATKSTEASARELDLWWASASILLKVNFDKGFYDISMLDGQCCIIDIGEKALSDKKERVLH